jgi:hypothetical protein
MVPLSGILRLSRTMQSLSPSVIPKPNESTDLVRAVMIVRKASARNGRIAIRNWMMPLPHHEKRRPASQNVKTAILTVNQNESDKNPRLATKTRRKTRQRSGRSGPSQGLKNRKAGSNLRTSLPPLCPTLVPNPMDPPGLDGLGVLPQSQS